MSLPIELITEILLYLPAKTLVHFKLVSKQWKALINSRDFTDLHLDRSLAVGPNLHFLIKTPKLHLCDHDTFANPRKLTYPNKNSDSGGSRIVGICRGLACVWIFHLSTLYVYNPTTQTCKILLKLDKNSETFEFGTTEFDFGFGYDDVGQDYKCVRIFQNFDKETGVFGGEVSVYSLREGRWRHVEGNPYYFYGHSSFGVFCNGVLHWVGDNEGEGNQRKYLPIICFDLTEERFSSIELPEIPKWVAGRLVLGVIGGQLCLVVNHKHHFQFWVMEEYGVVGSWKRYYRVPKPQFYTECMRIIGLSRSGNELFVKVFQQVAKIDLESSEITDIEVPRLDLSDAVVCVENLMMLEDGIVAEEEREKKKLKDGREWRLKKGFPAIP